MDLVAKKNQQQGALETNRAATDRTGDKTKSLGLDRPHIEETRWTCSQEGTRVEPTGEAEEGDPSTLGDAREWQSWSGNFSRGMRNKTLHRIGLGGAL